MAEKKRGVEIKERGNYMEKGNAAIAQEVDRIEQANEMWRQGRERFRREPDDRDPADVHVFRYFQGAPNYDGDATGPFNTRQSMMWNIVENLVDSQGTAWVQVYPSPGNGVQIRPVPKILSLYRYEYVERSLRYFEQLTYPEKLWVVQTCRKRANSRHRNASRFVMWEQALMHNHWRNIRYLNSRLPLQLSSMVSGFSGQGFEFMSGMKKGFF